MDRRLPRIPLVPYTTLFRSARRRAWARRGLVAAVAGCALLVLAGSVTMQARLAESEARAARDLAEAEARAARGLTDREGTRPKSSHLGISYAVCCSVNNRLN